MKRRGRPPDPRETILKKIIMTDLDDTMMRDLNGPDITMCIPMLVAHDTSIVCKFMNEILFHSNNFNAKLISKAFFATHSEKKRMAIVNICVKRILLKNVKTRCGVKFRDAYQARMGTRLDTIGEKYLTRAHEKYCSAILISLAGP